MGAGAVKGADEAVVTKVLVSGGWGVTVSVVISGGATALAVAALSD